MLKPTLNENRIWLGSAVVNEATSFKYGGLQVDITSGSSENVYVEIKGDVHGKPGGMPQKIVKDPKFQAMVRDRVMKFARELGDAIDTFNA